MGNRCLKVLEDYWAPIKTKVFKVATHLWVFMFIGFYNASEKTDFKMMLYYSHNLIHFPSALKRHGDESDTDRNPFITSCQKIYPNPQGRGHTYTHTQTASSQRYCLMLQLLYTKHDFPFSAKPDRGLGLRFPTFNVLITNQQTLSALCR